MQTAERLLRFTHRNHQVRFASSASSDRTEERALLAAFYPAAAHKQSSSLSALRVLRTCCLTSSKRSASTGIEQWSAGEFQQRMIAKGLAQYRRPPSCAVQKSGMSGQNLRGALLRTCSFLDRYDRLMHSFKKAQRTASLPSAGQQLQ
jgi:hypothetical protein